MPCSSAGKIDACDSGDTAQDPLCAVNTAAPVCFEPVPNPWIFNCRSDEREAFFVTDSLLFSQFTSTSTITLPSTASPQLQSTTVASSLTSWQIGLICGIGQRNLLQREVHFSLSRLSLLASLARSSHLRHSSIFPEETRGALRRTSPCQGEEVGE